MKMRRLFAGFAVVAAVALGYFAGISRSDGAPTVVAQMTPTPSPSPSSTPTMTP